MHEISIKRSLKDSDLVRDSKVLQTVPDKFRKCCTLCKSEGKSLEDSLFIIKDGKPGNANDHLKKQHKKFFDAKAKEEAAKLEEKKKRKSPATTSNASSNSNSKKTKQSSLPLISQNRRAGTAEERTAAVQQFEVLIARFVNNKALADSVVVDPHFREMIDFSINHGHLLGDYKHMGRTRFVSIQCKNWLDFNEKVSNLIKEICQFYIEATGRRQGFVCVSHDVWDGKRKEINGLTIFFIHPVTGVYYRIPLALAKPDVSASALYYPFDGI